MDFGQWLTTGNAPGWLAAVLSSASVFLALSIFRNDRKEKKRAFADGIVSWINDSTDIVENGTVIEIDASIKLFNAGDRPLPSIAVFELNRDSTSEAQFRPLAHVQMIGAGEERSFHVGQQLKFREFGKNSFPVIYLEILDVKNQRWYRDVRSNRYIKLRHLRKVARRNKVNLV